MHVKKLRLVVITILGINIALAAISYALNWHAMDQHPPKGSFVKLKGVTTHVIEAPSRKESPAATVVLIHGANTSALDFDNNLLSRLPQHYKVVAIDRPGHGYSERGQTENMHDPTVQAAALLDILASMDIERPILLGHSWAGSVVMAALLTKHSVEPSAGILLSGVTHPWDYQDSLITSTALAPVRGLFFRYQYLPIAGRLAIPSTIEQALAPEEVPENYIQDTGLHLSLRPSYIYNAQDRSNLSSHMTNLVQQYAQIKSPILSIAGSGDTVVPPELHHEKLVAQLDTVEGILIEGAGHAPHHTRTDRVVDLIVDFIEALPNTDT